MGILLGTPGALRRRAACLALWGGLGLLAAADVCAGRLRAEWYWAEAKRQEAQCHITAARAALERAVALCPDFESMERTWLLTGKLDFRQARRTPQERFFRAYQLGRDKTRPRAVAYHQDLPWLVARTQDYREGLEPMLAGYDLSIIVGVADSGTPARRCPSSWAWPTPGRRRAAPGFTWMVWRRPARPTSCPTGTASPPSHGTRPR
jgi:hypothetical protein